LPRKSTPTCRYHCRSCEQHFTSLAAFDAHKPRSQRRGGCLWPEDAPLGEIPGGECRIASDVPIVGITLYEHEDAARARQNFAEAA
jgi:hypothetical protein